MKRFCLISTFLVITVFTSTLILAQSKTCRAFAVGSKFRIEKAADYPTFFFWVDSLLSECAKHFAEDQPNLVVFGELFGMVTALMGDNLAEARSAKTLEEAFTFGANVYFNRFVYHKLSNLWFGISDERALLLSLTDNLYGPFYKIFPELANKYKCYIIAGTLSADSRRGSPSLTAWLMGYRDVSFSPRGNDIYNIAAFWGPDGELIGVTKKVNLTPKEIEMDLSRGKLENVEVYDTSMGKIGIAISLDAFREDYVGWLDDRGCQIIVQPDANDFPWADYQPVSGIWQPKEWMWSTFGTIQEEYENIQYNVCPMIVGNFFDLIFDGQSSITAKAPHYPIEAYVGVDLQASDPYYHGRYKGKFLAKADWVSEGGPIEKDRLKTIAQALKRGGSKENQYHVQIIWADLEVRP